jgi:hypothetical protein
MICRDCFQTRRRSFFTADGLCEECAGPAFTPAPLPDGPIWPLPVVIALAAKWCESNPWVPGGEARDRGGKSSADQLLDWVAVNEIPPCPLPMAALDWLASLHRKPEEVCSDYECRLVMLWRLGWVTPETFALAASAYHAWEREAKRAASVVSSPKKAELTGLHYGVLGTRMNIPGCQCYYHASLGVNPDHPEWGERFVINFTAATGEELVWFASAGGKFDPQPGGVYNIRATVSKHDEYQGRRSTILQRCEEYDPATGELLPKYKRTRKTKEPE